MACIRVRVCAVCSNAKITSRQLMYALAWQNVSAYFQRRIAVALCETGVWMAPAFIAPLCPDLRPGAVARAGCSAAPIQTFPMFTDRMHAADTNIQESDLTARSDASDVSEIVQGILSDIEAGGDAKALNMRKFDKYEGNVLLTEAEIEAAIAWCRIGQTRYRVQPWQCETLRRGPESPMQDIEVEVPRHGAGQKMMPAEAAGCYVPADAIAISPAPS